MVEITDQLLRVSYRCDFLFAPLYIQVASQIKNMARRLFTMDSAPGDGSQYRPFYWPDYFFARCYYFVGRCLKNYFLYDTRLQRYRQRR